MLATSPGGMSQKGVVSEYQLTIQASEQGGSSAFSNEFRTRTAWLFGMPTPVGPGPFAEFSLGLNSSLSRLVAAAG
jgi:hypothetical protein